ncbi:MAG: D-alanyl-D-alanine carboxypeptidase family protein [Bacilli bacterium]|nr:D-alanyl-D-alanine carboxypeptidase family protein [Bacilli bacterium]
MFLNLCQDSNALSVISLAKDIIRVIQIGVPIILILMCSIDLGKQIFNNGEKSYQKIIKKMLAATMIFFVPMLISLFLDLLSIRDYKMTDCWSNSETTTISYLKAQEKALDEKEKETRQKEKDKAEKERKELEENREKIRKEHEKAAEEAKKNNNNNNNPSSGTVIYDATLFNENGKDGLVDVVNGEFFKPSSGTSGADGTKGSGPYGYNIFFYNRLKAFCDAAKEAGHTVNMSTSVDGAWRSYARQKYFWDCYQKKNCNNGNLAARPGTSNHGWGIASDLSFSGYNAKLWAHDNAAKYGLKFPLCNNIRTGDCKEDWHIEPYVLKNK